jgi:hypothetical protein
MVDAVEDVANALCGAKPKDEPPKHDLKPAPTSTVMQAELLLQEVEALLPKLGSTLNRLHQL